MRSRSLGRWSAGIAAVVAGGFGFAAPAGAALVPGVPSFTAATSITVGNGPDGVVFAPDGTAYVGNYLDDTISEIDPSTGLVTTTFGSGLPPLFLAISPDGGTLYGAGDSVADMVVIDPATGSVTATINTTDVPEGLAVSPDGGTVYVSVPNANEILVIDAATDTVTTTIPEADDPTGLAVSPNGDDLYVASGADNTVSVVDTTTDRVTTSIAVGAGPDAVAVSPNGDDVYVANESGNSVSVIDAATDTVTATIPVGYLPVAVAVAPNGDDVYVVNESTNTVSVIDAATDTVVDTINEGVALFGVAVSPDGGSIYVTDNGGDTVSVIDASEVSIPTISAPGDGSSANVGDTLTAVPGAWLPSTVGYQWLAGGQPISGATSSTFAVTSAQAGKQVTVTVTNSAGSETSTPISVNVLPTSTTTTTTPTTTTPTPTTTTTTPTTTTTTPTTTTTTPKPAPKHHPTQRVHVDIRGLTDGATYFGVVPTPRCVSSTNTGTARCTIAKHTQTSTTGITTVTFTAHAAGSDGARATAQVTVSAETLSFSGLPRTDGAYVVKPGQTYTLKVVSRIKPLYVDAAVAPQAPSGVHDWFKRAGTENHIPVWSLKVYLHTYLSGFTTWNLGVRIGAKTNILTIKV